MTTPYVEALRHAGSAEVLYTGLFDEPAGTLARTMPRRAIASAGLAGATTGIACACLFPGLPAGLPVTNLGIRTGNTAAVGPTNFWLALADVNLRILGVTADQLAGAIGAAAEFLLPVTVPFLIPQTGPYYLMWSVSAATTMPTWAGGNNIGGMPAGAPLLCGTTTTQVSPPALGAQINAGTVTGTGAANVYGRIS